MDDVEASAPNGKEGERLRLLREQLGLSQRELAVEFNVSSGAIALWETGAREMSGPALRLLELFEKESRGALGPVEAPLTGDDDHPLPRSWLGRTLPPAGASLLLLLFRQFRVDEDTSPIARRVRLAAARHAVRSLAKLRGLAAKFAQMVSYMDFLLPESERALFAAVEKEQPTMSSALVERIIEDELGERPSRLFGTWTSQPLALGSIGQVHAATLPSGEHVVVKVQYPKIVEALQTDLQSVKLLDHSMSLIFRGQKPGVLFEELRARFLEECDYALEAERLRRFGELFAGRPDLELPRPYPELSSPHVLTMTRLLGLPFDAFLRVASQAARNKAATTLWTFHFESILRHGIYNADPHPGNLLFAHGKVKIVDFGRVRELPHAFVHHQRRIYRSVLERDQHQFEEALIDIGIVPDRRRFDFDFAYRSMLYAFLPFLRDEPFAFTPAFIRHLWGLVSSKNPNREAIHYPAEMTFFHQLSFGLSAVLARLGARVAYRSLLLPLLYDEQERVPPPFSAAECSLLEVADAPTSRDR